MHGSFHRGDAEGTRRNAEEEDFWLGKKMGKEQAETRRKTFSHRATETQSHREKKENYGLENKRKEVIKSPWRASANLRGSLRLCG